MTLPNPGVTPANWGAALNTEILARPQVSSFSTTATWRAPYAQDNGFQGGAATGTMYLWSFLCPMPLTLDGLAIMVGSAGDAAATLNVGIYTDNGSFTPGNKIADTGAMSSASAGTKQAIITDVVMPAGYYWMGYLSIAPTTTPTLQLARHMRDLWTVMDWGTGSGPAMAIGNDGTTVSQSGLAALPATGAAVTRNTDSNLPKIPFWIGMRVRRT